MAADSGKMGFDKRTRVIPPEGVDEEPEYGTDVDLDTTDAVVGNTMPSEERVTWSGPRRHAKGQTTSRVTTGTVITKLDTPPVERWETEYVDEAAVKPEEKGDTNMEMTCAICAKPMTGKASKRTCSDACKKKLQRQQKAKQAPNVTHGT